MGVVFSSSHPRVRDLATLVDAEFREMPGMRLTEAQIRRLWSLSPPDCETILGQLRESGILERDSSGRYLRRRSQI